MIETGQYVGEREEHRLCVLCNRMEIENEEHCLIRRNRYVDIRNTLFAAAINVGNDFLEKTDGKNSLLFYTVRCWYLKSYVLGHSFYTDKEVLLFCYTVTLMIILI